MEEQQNAPQPNWTTWWNHAISTTVSPTVTSWRVFHAGCAALAPHTGVERHSAFKLRAHTAVATRLHQLTSSGGPHKRCPHTDGATVLRFTKHPFRRRVPLRIHEDLVFPTHSHPTPARCGADSSAQGCFCRCDHPATAHGVRPFILASCSFFSHDDLQFASVPILPFLSFLRP